MLYKKIFGKSKDGFASQSQVDDALTYLVIKLELSFGKITVPKIARCCICHSDVDETQEFMHGFCCKSSMLHKHCAIDTLKATSDKCPLCKGDFHPDLDVWSDAVYYGDLQKVDYCLLSGRINVNAAIEEGGQTALLCAAREEKSEVVERLLKVPGIDVNAQDGGGWTALGLFVSVGNLKMVNQLLRMPGIDVNSRYGNYNHGDGHTILMLAVMNGFYEIVARLLRVPGIDINAQDDERGWTALMYAAEQGKLKISNKLLEHPGIDLNMRNDDGHTALKIAKDCRHKLVAGRLRRAGAIL